MADILIRGMDKPHNCFQCDLSYLRGERLFCHVTKDEVLRSKIASDCPIQELPEHGDLIDRDALIKTCNEIIDEDWNAKAAPYSWSYAYESFVDDIVVMPVIVSASKEETE